MIELSISKETIQIRLSDIFEFIYDGRTNESLIDKLNIARHVISGMQIFFADAEASILDKTIAAEYDEIKNDFVISLKEIEMLYKQYASNPYQKSPSEI